MEIRAGKPSELNAILKVIESAFPAEENNIISKFVYDLLSASNSIKIKNLVAARNNEVLGYVSFSPIYLDSDSAYTGHILAPLAVAPEHQKHGIGQALVNSGIDLLKNREGDLLLVYGDPNYYGRFGFSKDAASTFVPPFELKYPMGWLGLKVSDKPPPAHPAHVVCVDALNNPDLW